MSLAAHLGWLLPGSRGDTRQQEVQALCCRGMRENRVAQDGVRQSAQHCRLNGRHHLARFGTEDGESKDAVAFAAHEHLHKSTGFTKSDRSQHPGHGYLRQPVCDAPFLRFRFVQADSRQIGISEHAEGYESVARCAAAAVQVITDHAEIVKRDVCELRAACAIAHRPDAR